MKRFICIVLGLLLLALPLDGQARSRTKGEIHLLLSGGSFYGVTDGYDVFFPIPASSIKHAGSSTRIGLDYVFSNGFGLRPQFGFERIFYTSIGIQEAAKSQFVLDFLLSKFLTNCPNNRWQPYVALGPSVAFSTSGKQGYLKITGGTLYLFNRHWGLHFDSTLTTEFTGARAELAIGINYKF